MGLKKGQTNNPDGRPKGSKNKVGEQLRETIAAFLEQNFEKIQKDFWSTKLSRRDRLKFYTDLLPYAVPRLQSTTMDINFDQLSDDQLNEIIERLITSATDQESESQNNS